MPKIMKKLLMLFGVLLFTNSLFAQEEINHPIDLSKITKEWSKVYEQDGIVFEVNEFTCPFGSDGNKATYVGMKLTNTTNEKKLVRYETLRFKNEKCSNCNDLNEYLVSNTLNPSESVEADCETNKNQGVFWKWTVWDNKQTLTSLKLKTVEVYNL